METPQERAFGNAAISLVAGVFLNEKSAGDAIADLNLAGFHASDVGVAVSAEDLEGRPSGREPDQQPGNLQKEHSLFWKIRHANAHDLQRRGAGLSSREEASAAKEKPAYTVLNLMNTLHERGIPEDTVHLLSREVGADGILILVKAGERVNKVESLLERNRGFIRTAMACEVPHLRT